MIATKFGYTYDTGQMAITGEDASPGYIRQACEASLRRLGTDRVDLYQLHLGELPAEQAQEAADALEDLVRDGLIRSYGWSTDDPARAAALVSFPHYTAVQHDLNVLDDTPGMLEACGAAHAGQRQPDAAGHGPADRQVRSRQPAAVR